MPTIEELFRSKQILSGDNEIATADVLVDSQSKKYKDDIVASDGSIIAAPIRAYQTKQTKSGKTEAFLTQIRNSKDLEISSNDSALNGTAFVLANKLRKNTSLTVRTGETFREQELVGLRQLRLFSEPVIYGTDIFRINTKTTSLVTTMKNAAGGVDSNLLQKAVGGLKTLGNKIASKLGIQFPQTMIPSNIAVNGKFTVGKEPNTMETLATIKQDAAGNLMGKFLQQSVKGTPTQILTNLKQNGVTLVKNELGKLFKSSGISAAQQNLGITVEGGIRYDSYTMYSNTVLPTQNDNILLRNDLSSRLEQYKKLQRQGRLEIDSSNSVGNQFSKLKNVTVGGQKANDLFSQMGGTSGTVLPGGIGFIPPTGRIQSPPKDLKLSGKQQQVILGTRIEERLRRNALGVDPYFQNLFDKDAKYEDTLDETIDDDSIFKRGDLSSAYATSLINAARLAGVAQPKVSDLLKAPVKYTDGAKERFKGRAAKNSNKISDTEPYIRDTTFTIDEKRGINTHSDFLNSKSPYESAGEKAQLKDGTFFDDYDFVTLKFWSLSVGTAVNFRATISGLTETFAPSWDTNKFVGNPFNFYTYNSVERSVTFNFKVFSMSITEHQAAWSRLTFLATMVYPQGYSDNVLYATPPIIKFTLGNMYQNKSAFIESLTYTIDDNTTWEDGIQNAHIAKNYILPKIVDVSITLKLIESIGTTYSFKNKYAKRLYGFGTIDAAVRSKYEEANNLNPDGSPKKSTTNAEPKGVTVDASVLQGLGMKDYAADFGANLQKVENPLNKANKFNLDSIKPIKAPPLGISSYYKSLNEGKSSLLQRSGMSVSPGSAEANLNLIEPKAEGLTDAQNAAWEAFATTQLNS